ncbi:MAG: hypothetical protein EBQ92_05295 [Proteobacteria bacterium]|nr:hypothetical protein [Pseudomonadota bacterium]
MKNTIVVFLAVLMVAPAFADKRGTVLRGGLGFLFPDANRFVNGGQSALNKGTSLEANYSREDETKSQDMTASLTWGNGQAGLGAGVSRVGTTLSEPSTSADTMVAQGGFAFGGGQFTLGGVYQHSLETGVVGQDVVSGQLNVNLGKPGQGWVLGVGASTTLGRATNTKTGTAALGYAFGSGLMVEGGYQVDDFADSANNYRYTAAAVYNSNAWYGAAQYSAVTQSGTHPDSVSARLGGIWGKVDLSAQVTKETYTGGDTTYGGTLRYVF